jgi:hypothetical protein
MTISILLTLLPQSTPSASPRRVRPIRILSAARK